jgi:hypothetical protein
LEHRRVFANDLSQAIGAFHEMDADDVNRFRATVRRLGSIAITLPFDAAQIEESFDLSAELGLEEFDALIIAAILHHIRNEASGEYRCFVSKDKDFDRPEIQAALRSVQCEQVSGFQQLLVLLDRR